MSLRLFALAAACMLASYGNSIAGPVAGQGTWETTLLGRDIDGNPVAANSASAVFLYDSALKITWLRNANYAKTTGYSGANANGEMQWQIAIDWATSLTIGKYSNWRLPRIIDTSAPGCDWSLAGGTDCGYNVDLATSEMAHLWYSALGNLSWYTPGTGIGPQPGWGLTNTGDFEGLVPNIYWSGTKYAPTVGTSSENSWMFSMSDGQQADGGTQTQLKYVVLVRDGDVLASSPVNSLTFQGVTFTTRLVGNTFDVEIDAASRNGDWASAMYIDAIELSGIGTFLSFSMGEAGVSWTPKKANLSASGCKTGRGTTDACAEGTALALGDNMHFTFTFNAGAVLDDIAPVLTVRFLNAKMKKQGSLLGQPIPRIP